MSILNGTTLILAGLVALTTAAVAVTSVTLYKNYKQGEKLEEFNTSLVAIENNNQQVVQGLTTKLEDSTKKQEEANKKNNPKLISAEKDVEEAQKRLDNLKLAQAYIKDEFPVFLQALIDNAGAALDVDSSWMPFLAGPNALAAGAGTGIHDMTELVNRIADAAGKRTEAKMVNVANCNSCWGILNNAAAAAAQAAPNGNCMGTTNCRLRSLAVANDAVKAAEKDLKEKKTVYEAIEKTLG